MTKYQLYIIIKESLYNILYESLQTQRQKYGKELVNKLLPLDPSKTYKYIEAICSYYEEGINKNTIKDYIDKFDTLQNKNLLKNKDINQYKTFDQLKNIVDNSSFKTKSSIKKEVYSKPYKTIENDKGTWLVYKPQTEEESILLGKNTKWCTQQKNDNMFNNYYIEKNVDFYYIINKETQDKYQIVLMSNNKIEEIRNSADELITTSKFKELTGIDPYQFKFDKKNLNGEYVTRYDNGKTKTITHYKDGVKDGEYEEYYENGNIKLKCNFKNGKIDGNYILYDENGNPRKKYTYKNNILNGEYIEYYSNGNIKLKCNFKNGEINGKYITYYPNGKIQSIQNIKTDKSNGKYIKYGEQFLYYENGNIKEKRNYKNGKLVGKIIKYSPNGTMIKT